MCYGWIVTLQDNVGNNASAQSAMLLADVSAPDLTFADLAPTTTTLAGSDAFLMRWSETDASSGIASRSVQREAAPSTGSSCPTSGWSSDGSPLAAPPPIRQTGLALDTCYRWTVHLTDLAGNTTISTSGSLRVGPIGLNFVAPGDLQFSIESIVASVSPSISVDRVEFLVDGAVITQDATSPYSASWDTTSASPGAHTIRARVVEVQAGRTSAAAVDVSVDDTLPSATRVAWDATTGRVFTDETAVYGVLSFRSPERPPSAVPIHDGA